MARIVDVWQAAQVELRGHYSLKRFHEILQHARQTRRWQHLGMMLFTPLPGLVSIVMMDVLPMNAPEDGVLHQSLGYYLRCFVLGWLMAHMMLIQTHASSPTLPLSTARHWAISLTTGGSVFAAMLVLGSFVAFPTPFLIHLTFPLWLVTFASTIWFTWKDALAADPDAKRKVLHYVLIVFNAQSAMFFVYSSYTVAFNRIPVSYQTWFTFLLPVIKLGFKNWVIKGVLYMEDLAPTIVVFNVDVYHAIFVSSTMQSASTWGSVAVVMAIDVVQSVIAYHELTKVLHFVNKLALQSIADDNSEDAATIEYRTRSQQKLQLGVIDYALHVLSLSPRISSCLAAAQPANANDSQSSQQTRTFFQASPRIRDTCALQEIPLANHSPEVWPTERPTRVVPLSHTAATAPDCQSSGRAPVNDAERVQLECVTGVLKLLHMVELYVLIEFAEAIVPIINALYIRAMVYLPNRVYYWSLADLSQDEMSAKADRVAIYASLELLSFVLFCYVVDRRLHHTSTYQILAFGLAKHAQISLTTLTMWIYFIVQLGVQHIGVDYTFQFKWLHKRPAAR